MVFNFQQFQQMSITFFFFFGVRPFVNYFVCQTLIIGMALCQCAGSGFEGRKIQLWKGTC
jgi:hypothetical protein